MPVIDMSRKMGRHKKRDVSVAAYFVSESELAALFAEGPAVSTDTFHLAKLPSNILITASATTVLVPFSVAATMNVGMVGGIGTEFASAVALDAAADTVVAGSGDISEQTGATVAMTLTGAGSVAIDGTGLAVVTVEYIEYEQCTGELTNFAS